MADILGENRDRQIPYPLAAQTLFEPDWDSGQKLIPFLGAGVSTSNSGGGRDLPAPRYPDAAAIDKVAADLGVTGRAKDFLEIALLVTCRVQAAQEAGFAEEWVRVARRLRTQRYPPSVGALTEALCELQQYTTFQETVKRLAWTFESKRIRAGRDDQIAALRLAARVTGVADPPDALTSISSLFQTRYQLWNELRRIIAPKKTPTLTHELLADAAMQHVRNRNYLMITTNYDCLLERALLQRRAPFVVLSTRFQRDDEDQITNSYVVARFSWHVRDRRRLQREHQETRPDLYSLPATEPLAVVYKIHGDLHASSRLRNEGVVITDSDYIFMTAQKSVPSVVVKMMETRSFLFLGYSLSDWNVRSIFDDVRRTRGTAKYKDIAVMKRVRPFEEAFCQNKDITIYETDLNSYVEGVRANV
jgi:hypothetical protein